MASVGIYLDSDTCRWQLDQTRIPVSRYTNLDIFSNSAEQRKVSAFHIPFPYLNVKQEFEQRIDTALAVSDVVVVLVSELHNETVDFILRYANKNIHFFTCGFVDSIKTDQWMDWFITSSYFYKNNPVLEQLTPYTPKEKLFDILLGQKKPHRDLIHNHIVSKQLQDRVVMSYLNHVDRIVEGANTPGWIWPEGELEILHKDLQWTVSQVVYQGQQMSLSQVVPINIYNQTAYSIIAETNFANHYSFYTEKTVKPILGRRLFLAFSGQYFLRNLRSLGFKTFDGIIDESYDTVADMHQRGQMIVEQMDYLFTQDQSKILKLVKPIAEHNYQQLIKTDWNNFHVNNFKNLLMHAK